MNDDKPSPGPLDPDSQPVDLETPVVAVPVSGDEPMAALPNECPSLSADRSVAAV
jgi:hypothetical protein